MMTIIEFVFQNVVKNEDLLIWNPKEGWEPLCSFLNVPVPAGKDIPVANKTSDTGYIGKFFQRRLSKITLLRMVSSQLLITLLLYGVPIYASYKSVNLYLPRILEKIKWNIIRQLNSSITVIVFSYYCQKIFRKLYFGINEVAITFYLIYSTRGSKKTGWPSKNGRKCGNLGSLRCEKITDFGVTKSLAGQKFTNHLIYRIIFSDWNHYQKVIR